MKIPTIPPAARWLCAAAVLTAGAVIAYPAARNETVPKLQEREAARSVPDQSTGLNDQTELNVTVYNSNIALVRDVRNLVLPAGTFRLKFMDIAATVNPATVHFRSLTGPDIVTGMFAESYRFPEVPANLYDRPTLVMSLENSGPRKQQIEASYLANNLSWNADYALTVARDDKNADLDGWVTVVNNSGTAFHNAHLQLVAGEVNRVQPPAVMETFARNAVAAKAAAPQFAQEAFSEYHLYTLGRKTSVEDKETKQISLLEGSGIPVEKVFAVNGQSS